MNNPILTIGIPTYNHGHFLEKCLKAITDQFADKEVFESVEIFISDNGDGGATDKIVDEYHSDNGKDDKTQEIVKAYQKRFSNIRYSRNGRNIGFDRNVDAVLTNARGKFCWTLSSNEYIEPGSISYILSIIKKYPDISYICISNQKVDKGKPDVRWFKNGNQWLKEMGVFGGQISQCVFNLQYLPPDRAKYYDNAWFHLALFWEIIAHRPNILVPYLFIPPESYEPCAWANGGWGFRTYIYLKMVVAGLVRYGYDPVIINDLISRLAAGLPRAVASARIHGLPVSWNNFRLITREFYRNSFHLALALMVFFTPTFLLRMAKSIK